MTLSSCGSVRNTASVSGPGMEAKGRIVSPADRKALAMWACVVPGRCRPRCHRTGRCEGRTHWRQGSLSVACAAIPARPHPDVVRDTRRSPLPNRRCREWYRHSDDHCRHSDDHCRHSDVHDRAHDDAIDSGDARVVFPITRIVHDAVRLVSRAQLMVYPTDTINSATQRINDHG